MLQAISRLQVQAEANTNFVAALHDKLAGVEAHTHAVEEAVDLSANTANAKELISYLYEKSHQYVATIIAGAFAAYFATLNALADRFHDNELRVSALLMTFSLTVFVGWEITSMAMIGWRTVKGDLEAARSSPKWLRIGWPLAMFASLATAIPAIGLSMFVYLRGLGATAWLARLW